MSSVRRDGEQVDKSQSIRILNKQIVYNIETINWWGLLSLAMDSRLSFRQAYYIAVQSLAGARTHACVVVPHSRTFQFISCGGARARTHTSTRGGRRLDTQCAQCFRLLTAICVCERERERAHAQWIHTHTHTHVDVFVPNDVYYFNWHLTDTQTHIRTFTKQKQKNL